MVLLRKYVIHGRSMFPTYKPGDRILASSLPYVFVPPKTGDIIICVDPRKKRVIVKRIVDIKNTMYVVRGDNENESTDSRIFGALTKKDILGKVIWKV